MTRRFNYYAMPDLSRDGIKSSQGKFLTIGLFAETALPDAQTPPHFCLGENEVYHEPTGRWLPSAYLTYLACKSEYEAMRKIVGSIRQWEMLKKLAWFQECLSEWRYEQAEIQKAKAKEVLLDQIAEGNLQAAKALFAQLEKESKPPVGRPAKVKPGKTEPEANAQADEDFARVVAIRS